MKEMERKIDKTQLIVMRGNSPEKRTGGMEIVEIRKKIIIQLKIEEIIEEMKIAIIIIIMRISVENVVEIIVEIEEILEETIMKITKKYLQIIVEIEETIKKIKMKSMKKNLPRIKNMEIEAMWKIRMKIEKPVTEGIER